MLSHPAEVLIIPFRKVLHRARVLTKALYMHLRNHFLEINFIELSNASSC